MTRLARVRHTLKTFGGLLQCGPAGVDAHHIHQTGFRGQVRVYDFIPEHSQLDSDIQDVGLVYAETFVQTSSD